MSQEIMKQEVEHYETPLAGSKSASELVPTPPEGGSVQEEDEEPPLPWRSWVIVSACGLYYCGTLIVLVSTGFWIVQISEEIGGAATGLWLSQSFQVMNSVLGPIFGQIGDSAGRKWLMVGGITLGCIGSLVIATAHSMPIAILGSIIYGFDWCLVSTAMSIASEVTTRRWRPRAQLFLNVTGSSGLLLGAMCGAAFIVHQPGVISGWRDNFYLSFALLAVSGILILVFYHPEAPPNPRGLTIMQRLLECDLVGASLFGMALVPLLMGLIWGGQTAPWKSAQVLAPLLIGISFLFIFGYHQRFLKKNGLLNHEMFKSRNVVVSVFGTFVEGMVYIIFNQYYGVVTATLYEARTIFLALRFSGFLIANIVASFLVQWISYRWRTVKVPLIGGYTFFLIGMVGMATLAADSPVSSKLAVFWSVSAGVGFAAPIALLIVTAQLGVDPKFIGLISGLLISSRSVGGAVGVAVATAVYQSKITTALPKYISDAALRAGLPESSLPTFVAGISSNNATLAGSASGATAEILAAGGAAALKAYAYSFSFIWVVVAPFVLVALLLCFLLTDVSHQMTYTVDRKNIEGPYHGDHILEHAHKEKA